MKMPTCCVILHAGIEDFQKFTIYIVSHFAYNSVFIVLVNNVMVDVKFFYHRQFVHCHCISVKKSYILPAQSTIKVQV